MQSQLVRAMTLVLALALTAAASARAADPTPAPSGSSVVASVAVAPKSQLNMALGPYDSSLALSFPLWDKPIPTLQSDDYGLIFRDLMQDSLVPHYMQLQADVYPVPVLATWLKSHSPHTYKKGDLSNTGVNLVESSSTSYLEPWAVSAFFGNIADLQLPGRSRNGNDLGYAGWMLRAGAQNLDDNVLIQDKWYQVEWRISGNLDGAGEKLSWNLRVGSKFHANPYITDVTYIGFARDNLDFRQSYLSWLMNSHVDVELEFSHDGGRVVREQFIVGKKFPFPERGYALTLDTGVVWDSPYEYSGPLRTDPKSEYTLVLEPGIEF